MATLVTKIVDTDGGVGVDYTSLSGAESGEQKNLVTADEIMRFDCRASGGAADGVVTFHGWTTDATRYVECIVHEDHRHDGVWNTGKYRIEATNDRCININLCGHIYFVGFQLYTTNTSTNNFDTILINYSTSYFFHVSKSIVKDGGNGKGSGVYALTMGASAVVEIYNNVFYDYTDGQAIIVNDSSITVKAYNNTVHNCKIGYRRLAGTFQAKNCLAKCYGVDSGFTDFSGTFTSSNNNASSDATAPGTSSRTSQTFTFENEGSDNFALAVTDAGAKDYGATLTEFSDDIIGNPRTGSWDIGAFEYYVASSTDTGLLDGKVVISSKSTDLLDGKVVILSEATNLLDGKVVILSKATNLLDGKVIIISEATDLLDGKVVILSKATNLLDGKVVISSESTDLLDGKMVILSEATDLLDGKVIILSESTELLDGKVVISSKATDLLDGKVEITTAGIYADLLDGKLVILSKTSDLLDGKVSIIFKASDLLDGKLFILSKTSDLLDGKVSISSKASDLLDGKLFILSKTTDLLDGKLVISSQVAKLLDGKVEITSTGAGFNFLDGKIIIKNKTTDILDGKIVILNKDLNLLDGKICINTYIDLLDGFMNIVNGSPTFIAKNKKGYLIAKNRIFYVE